MYQFRKFRRGSQRDPLSDLLRARTWSNFQQGRRVSAPFSFLFSAPPNSLLGADPSSLPGPQHGRLGGGNFLKSRNQINGRPLPTANRPNCSENRAPGPSRVKQGTPPSVFTAQTATPHEAGRPSLRAGSRCPQRRQPGKRNRARRNPVWRIPPTRSADTLRARRPKPRRLFALHRKARVRKCTQKSSDKNASSTSLQAISLGR